MVGAEGGVASEPVVRAAGGLLWRMRSDGTREFALVHRPRYDDWTFPKGKIRPEERDEDAALREVEEETGFLTRLGEPVGEVRYRDRKERPKVVRYWSMTVIRGGFVPSDEVDDLGWHQPHEALALLSYEHDRNLLRTFLEAAPARPEDVSTKSG